jgi:hypothetical protein
MYPVLLVLLLATILLFVLSRAIKKQMKPDDKRGEMMAAAEQAFERATARVLWATYLQDYQDQQHAMYGIHLQVERADGTTYKHTHCNPERKQPFWVIRKGDMVHLKEGEVLPIRIHAQDPRWIFFEFEFK